MDGDLNVESALTINKISSTLHCFVCEENSKEVVQLSMLKCLTYSLIRNFEICAKVQIFYIFFMPNFFLGFGRFKRNFHGGKNHDFKDFIEN